MKKPTSCLAIALILSTSVSYTHATDALSIDSDGNVAISQELTVQKATALQDTLTVDGETTLNSNTTIVSGSLTLDSPSGGMVLTSLGINPKLANTPSASIEVGPDAYFFYLPSQAVDLFGLMAPNGAGILASYESSAEATTISSPREDKWLHITSNGKAITVSNDGAPPENPHASATLHVDGIVVHKGLLKLSDKIGMTDIKSLTSSLQRILDIEGVEYQSTDSPSTQAGFVAQNVETAIPEAVSKDQNGTLYLDYDALIPHLVEAIKEQQAVIEKLETRLLAIETSP